MTALRAGALTALLLAAAGLVDGQRPAEVPADPAAPAFSPLGFQDLLAYQQAFPATPGHPLVIQASASKYWAFRGLAYRESGEPQGAVWTTVGPQTTLQNPEFGSSENVSGRVSALAISPACELRGPCRLWVGAAGGGVWRSDDAMNTDDVKWRWVSQGLGTNSIGSLATDPNDRTGSTILVGTGETNQPNNSGAGTGLYRSTDGGDRWTRIPTMITDPAISAVPIDFTFTRGISTVVVEPGNSQTIYVATTSAMLGMTAVRGGQTQTTGFPQPRVGLYKTQNGGTSWSLVWVPPLDPVVPANPHIGVGVGDTMFGVRHVRLDPRNPRIVYATAWNNAIHRSAPSLEGGDSSFKPVFAIAGLRRFRDLAMFDITVRNSRTRLYVYNGTESLDDQSLYRLDNADVPASTLVQADAAGTLVNTNAWIKLSSNDPGNPGSTSRRLCGSQCFYDLVVAVPEDRPDTVYAGGVATPVFGDPTIRSTNAGESFSSFGRDAQTPRNVSHVDVRAIVFHPRDSNIVFVGSDGGVVRNDGTFANISGRCQQLYGGAPQCQTVLADVPTRLYFLNRGLQTMQFYNVAIDPRAPLRRMMGGLQDNGTIWLDGRSRTRVWTALLPLGDGTSACGFHPTRPEVLFASFQSNRFFTNFRNGELAAWARTDDPIRASNERASITQSTGRQFITFDQAVPDTQYTGFQHIWRTRTNGGSQAFLEGNCSILSPASGATCGDWVPLGVAYPFPAGSGPDSPGRRPGDLTSDFYGRDRVGGLIVAAERTPADRGTLWAATNMGRLFVTKNADAAGIDVEFVRIDTPATPHRFVTRIVVDRTDPNVAFISYSGFNALTPATPGHVFRVVYDAADGSATFTSMDFDLGDIPINTLAFDDLRGDLYAGTDFGPLLLRRGSSRWELAGVGFPQALMVDLKAVPEQRVMVAATHGLGIFYLNLPPVE
ncbi:MAG TPA: hypothetical protein VLD67_14545 [Vicinamibacterales bacterium]|nr:hypothetical protein [Vicinamibacterales bacterium]